MHILYSQHLNTLCAAVHHTCHCFPSSFMSVACSLSWRKQMTYAGLYFLGWPQKKPHHYFPQTTSRLARACCVFSSQHVKEGVLPGEEKEDSMLYWISLSAQETSIWLQLWQWTSSHNLLLCKSFGQWIPKKHQLLALCSNSVGTNNPRYPVTVFLLNWKIIPQLIHSVVVVFKQQKAQRK